MANKLNYDSKTLLNFKFSPKEKGYDPLEVDQIFDNIISDYETLTSELKEAAIINDKQKETIDELKEELDKVNLELASLKKQFASLKKKSSINDDNYKLVTKVAAYERVLHRKGIDLKKALSDPDNC